MPFYYHLKKSFTYPIIHQHLPLLCTIKEEFYFSMKYTSKSIVFLQVLFDIKNTNYSSSTTLSALDYIIHIISNYYIEKKKLSVH